MNISNHKKRLYFVYTILICVFILLIARLFYLNIFDNKFLKHQGYIRSIRFIDIPAHRGIIFDRNNIPLAISSPVYSVWINPKMLDVHHSVLWKLSRILNLKYGDVLSKSKEKSRWFIYLKRRVVPSVAEKIKEFHIDGLFFKKEYKRFYPSAEASATLLGFTNINDVGQEGLELAYNSWLQGFSGKLKVLKDRLGEVIANISVSKKPIPGHDLVLSIDSRIQYLAYRALKDDVERYRAKSGSLIVLDCRNGEVLADASFPSFNPNTRRSGNESDYKNRALTDIFEPGSTMKAFSIISALDSGKYTPKTKIDTNPGWLIVDHNKIDDEHINHGVLTLTGVLQKSSNVGAAKVTLSLPAMQLWNLLHRFGFGERTGSGFPGEASGSLIDHRIWRPFVLATLAFGYGVSATTLQLARAYAVIANDGIKLPVTFIKLNEKPVGKRIISKRVANEMLLMLESVVKPGGTGIKAHLVDYRVAGKTGTAYIAGRHGYNKHKYIASFVGIAPVSNPRLVVAVVIRDPMVAHYGGIVAAPVFASVMSGALRYLNIPPDKS